MIKHYGITKEPEMIQNEVVGFDVSAAIGWVINAISVILSLVVKAMWDEIKILKSKGEETTRELSETRIVVAGDYVKHDQFNRMMDAIFKKLDKIDDRLANRNFE